MEDLLTFCEGRLAYYAVPRHTEFVDALPKTGTQQVQMAVLKQRGKTPAPWDREAAGLAVKRS